MTNQTERKSFIIHKDSLSVLKKLNIEQKANLFDAIANYQIESKFPEDSFISIIFEPFLNQFLRDEKTWQNVVERNKNNIAKRWNKSNTKNTSGKSGIPNDTKNTDSDSKSDSDSKNDIKEISSLRSDIKKNFQKPFLKDVIEYCQERKNFVNAEKWFAYYEANGWKVGKNPMKDWKAAVRTWENNEKQSSTTFNFDKWNKY